MGTIKGKDFHIFLVEGTGAETTYRSIAYATSHKLTVNRELIEIASKDSGEWAESESGKASWSVTIDALYADDLGLKAAGYDNLMTALVAGTAVKIVACQKSDAALENGGWTPGTGQREGMALIESIDLTASEKETSTYSVSLKGTGPLV